jgi:immunoglobulin-binding protein 1
LAQNPAALQNDDSALRDLYLTNIRFCAHQAFQSLESIAQELQILALAPPVSPRGTEAAASDHRARNSAADEYSDRLDPPISQPLARGKVGLVLNKDGKPLRPFTLLDNREQLRKGVFRPGHNLPTMTIDEYLEEERRRGGIIEGGGGASGVRPELDEDNYEKADQETVKARAWDEFKEANPKYVFLHLASKERLLMMTSEALVIP